MYASTLSLLILVVTVAPETAQILPRHPDVIKKEYLVRPGGTLRVEMDRGNIEVEVWDENRVFIELERVVRGADDETADKVLRLHEYAFEKRGNEVSVSSQFHGDRGQLRFRRRHNLRISLTVRVPARFNVTFENGAGNVELEDVRGFIEGSTGAGNVTLEEIEGEVTVSSGAGNVSVSGAIASADVATGAGNISLQGLLGAVRADTGVGNIEALILEQPEGDSELSTGAGNVVVSLAEDVAVSIKANTAMGSADCAFPLEISRSFMSKSFKGDINGGGAEIEMDVGMGNVVLKRH